MDMYPFLLLIVYLFSFCLSSFAEPVEPKEGNPKPSIITSFCFQGCNLGFQVCLLQKREKPVLQDMCKETVKRCNAKCENKN